MRVLIDGRPLQTPSAYRGIGRYVSQLVRTSCQDPRCRLLFFRGDDIPTSASRIVLTSSPRRLITLSDSLFLPPLFNRNNISLYHSTAYALPRRAADIRYLLTVYDLTPLKLPHGVSWRHFQVFRRIVDSAKRADLILPISEKTAADLQEFVRIDPSRVRIIRPMLDERIDPEHSEKPDVLIPGEYLFYVGGADPSKNLETLLAVAARLRIPLLIAGRIGNKRRTELLSGIAAVDHHLIVFTGYVSDTQLSYLYSHASAFVFPSFNEGFGYPPLEALRCGTTPVVSRAGALPEILGEAAVFVDDPLNLDEWCFRIRDLLESPGLRKEKLAQAGRTLPRYSPAAFKDALRQVYFETP